MDENGTGAKIWLMRRASALNGRLWWTRAMTLGVRALVIEGDDVLLVRHTYLEGWYLPGGGVDRGESTEAAVVRELREEAGIRCLGRPKLHGLFRNQRHSRRDHVACYLVQAFERGPLPKSAAWEIAEVGFFPRGSLPDGTSPATRARLAEVFEGRTVSENW